MNVRTIFRSTTLLIVLLATAAFAQTPALKAGRELPSGSEQQGTTPTPESAESQLYIIFVMDFSPAMDLPVGEDVPPQVADLASKVKAILDNQQYIDGIRALNTEFGSRPEVIKARQDNLAATAELDQWMTEHGYEAPYPNPNSKFAVYMDDIGCKQAATHVTDNQMPNQLFIQYFNDFLPMQQASIDQVVATVAQLCQLDNVTLTEDQKSQVSALLAFLADPEYVELRRQSYETNTALFTVFGTLMSDPAVQEVGALIGGQGGFDNYISQLGSQTQALGIPTGMTLATTAGQVLGQTAVLDRRATGRITTLDGILYHYEALEVIRDYGTISPMSWVSDILFRGGNNMGEALTKAIENMPEEHRDQPALIMLLDAGEPNVGMTADEILSAIPPKARERNVTICSAGFGTQESDTPAELLRGLADQTGGRYLHVSADDRGAMLSFVVACRQSLIGDVLEQFTGSIKQDETVEAGRITVGSTEQMNVTLTYFEGRVSMKLVDPAGKIVDVSYQNATNLSEQNTQVVTVNDPQPGAWVVRLTGDEVPETGTDYSVVAAADKSTGTPAWVWVLVAFGVVAVGGGAAAFVMRDRLMSLLRNLTGPKTS